MEKFFGRQLLWGFFSTKTLKDRLFKGIIWDENDKEWIVLHTYVFPRIIKERTNGEHEGFLEGF